MSSIIEQKEEEKEEKTEKEGGTSENKTAHTESQALMRDVSVCLS